MTGTLARNYALDNAKLFLVFLVVLGHILEPTIDTNTANKSIYLFIYIFHMPMFALISGMVSKKNLSTESIHKITVSLIIPLLVFQFLYESVEIISNGKLSNYTIHFQPYWILWYLLSLFFWRIGLYCISSFKFPLSLVLCVAILAGCFSETGYYLAISRTLTFFPFFVLGNKLTVDFLKKLNFKNSKLICGMVLFVIFCLCFVNRNIDYRWLWGSYSYPSLGYGSISGSFLRIFIYFISLIAGISFLALVPQSAPFMKLGAKNIVFVFLWHGFLIKGINGSGVTKFIESTFGLESFLPCIGIATILTFFLLNESVALYTNSIFLQPVTNMIVNVTQKRIG